MLNVMLLPIPLIAAASQVTKVTRLSVVVKFRKQLLRLATHAYHPLAVFTFTKTISSFIVLIE